MSDNDEGLEEFIAANPDLTESAIAKLKAAEEAAGLAWASPGSVADYAEMDAQALLALADVGAGKPPLLAQPSGYSRKGWIKFLADRGIAVPS